MTTRCIALLGRKDEPTDAVEEYCRYLSTALQAHDIQMEICRVTWEVDGWKNALRALQLQANEWRGNWVLLQYTALAWSARGFPQKVLRALKILKVSGARVGIVFHDVAPYPGTRLVDTIRRISQVRTMRRAFGLADLAIFTVSPENISWLSKARPNVVFIPVGPNLPIPESVPAYPPQNETLTVGVFSITGGEAGDRETKSILGAVRYAAERLGKLRLLVFGRHAELRETELREGLRDMSVEISVEGVVSPAQVVERLTRCDLLLFVRGNISSRRSSAIAGIACGLPLIAFSGSETASPIKEAGVTLIEPGQQNQLNAALVQLLSDPAQRAELAARSRAAYNEHFSWSAIARRYAGLFHTR